MKINIIGTKYYGYEDLEESLSYEYLQSINKFEGDEYFGYSANNEVALNFKEFKMFCKLYNIDLNNRNNNYGNDKDYFIKDKIIQELINKQEYQIYILSWC